MARASTQHKLDRVRPPRVQVTYDVEIGDAIEMKELPLLVGVVGDFNGTPVQPLPRLRDRKFIEVNPDTFDSVIEAINPHLAYSVDNKLSDKPDAGQLRVDLHFKSMEDFEPVNIVKQVEPLRELFELRVKLADLLGTLQGNERLNDLLLDAVTDADKLSRLRSELGGQHQPIATAETITESMAEAGPAIVERPIEAESQPSAAESTVGTESVATVAEVTAPAEIEATNEADRPSADIERELVGVEREAPEQESGKTEPETAKEP